MHMMKKKKIKRNTENKYIELKPVLDILKSIKGKTKGKVIAFALETHDGEAEAQRKLVKKGVDFKKIVSMPFSKKKKMEGTW